MRVTIKNPLSRFGRRLSFRFDNYAWILMCEVNGIELHEIGKLDEKVLLVTLIYTAYISDCRFRAKRERYTLDDIYKMLKRLTVDEVDQLKIAIANSRLLGKTMLEWADESGGDEKKS